MPHGHSHGGVACDGNHDTVPLSGSKKKKRKKKKSGRKKGGGGGGGGSGGGRSGGRSAASTARANKKAVRKKHGKHILPCCACKERGLPRHCCCLEMCCGSNGCGPRHSIKHLPAFECTDQKKYRPGQRRRHSRCFYCYRNLGNWLTALFILIGLGGAIAGLILFLQPCTFVSVLLSK